MKRRYYMARKARKTKIRTAQRSNNRTPFAGWEDMTGEQFHKVRRDVSNEIYQTTKASDLQNEVYKWMRGNGYGSSQIKNARKARVSVNIGVLCKLLTLGCPDFFPLHKDHVDTLEGHSGEIKPLSEEIKKYVDRYVAEGSQIEDIVDNEQQPAKVISIQDRMKEQMEDLFAVIEGHIDDWMTNGKVPPYEAYKAFKAYPIEIKPAHAKIIRDIYEPLGQELELSKTDPAVKEYYDGVPTRRINNGIKFFADIVSACDMVIGEGKVNRKPRKKKAMDATKLIANLKYKQRDTDYNLVSESPSKMVGANEVWVFNCKTRKLGKYIADELTGPITVKNNTSTLVGWDEHKSIQKTIRKPDEQLKGFTRLGKVALRKFLDNVNSKDAPLNGRLNVDTIILKIS